MKLYFAPLFFLIFVLPSCFIADSVFIEDETPELNLPLEVVAKDSIYHFIQARKEPNQKYLSYGYEPLKIIVPEEIKKKEEWESRKDVLGFDQKIVNNRVTYYDSIIKLKKLVRRVSLEHTFSLREEGDTLLDLQSVNFILSNKLKVLDFVPKYLVNLNIAEEKAFAKFYYESPIIKAYSYSESQSLSKNFYTFFKNEWYKKETSKEKELFLTHIISIIRLVQDENEFDVQSVSQELLKRYMRKKRKDIVNYKPIDFSPLYEINEDENLEGYYFFHTFSFLNDTDTDSLSVYVKFNLFYEVERIIETNESYEAFEE